MNVLTALPDTYNGEEFRIGQYFWLIFPLPRNTDRNTSLHAPWSSPSSEANLFSAGQEIPRILRNTKIHYRMFKYTSPTPILSQIDPIHAPPSSLPEDPSQYYPPIYSYASAFQVASFSQVSPPRPCTHLSSPHSCYMPVHLIFLDFTNRTISDEES